MVYRLAESVKTMVIREFTEVLVMRGNLGKRRENYLNRHISLDASRLKPHVLQISCIE
jgi:hypothetical protein